MKSAAPAKTVSRNDDPVSRPALLCACLVLALTASAQRGSGGGRPPGGGASSMGAGQNAGFPSPAFNRDTRDTTHDTRPPLSPDTRPPGPSPTATTTTRAGLQLGPPGRWWDDRNFAMSIGLSRDQQRKMDNVFNSNKGAIIDKYKALQKEESKLEAATHDPQPDKSRIFAAIDSVNQARAALEKANTQMLLQVRREMDAGQIARMDKFRETPPSE